MLTFNERSGAEFKARFYDAAGAPAPPLTVHWRLDSDQTLQDWTLATPTIVQDASGIREVSVTIEIPGSLHAITSGKARELRTLLVVANKDDSREFSEPLDYYVKNLRGRT